MISYQWLTRAKSRNKIERVHERMIWGDSKVIYVDFRWWLHKSMDFLTLLTMNLNLVDFIVCKLYLEKTDQNISEEKLIH